MNKKILKQVLTEMAQIGRTNDLSVWVYSEPLGNPSFHFRTKRFEVTLQIKDFKVLEWKFNRMNYKNIPLKDIRNLVDFLIERRTDGLTNWQSLITVWNAINWRFKIPYDAVSIEIPFKGRGDI